MCTTHFYGSLRASYGLGSLTDLGGKGSSNNLSTPSRYVGRPMAHVRDQCYKGPFKPIRGLSDFPKADL